MRAQLTSIPADEVFQTALADVNETIYALNQGASGEDKRLLDLTLTQWAESPEECLLECAMALQGASEDPLLAGLVEGRIGIDLKSEEAAILVDPLRIWHLNREVATLRDADHHDPARAGLLAILAIAGHAAARLAAPRALAA